MLKKTFGIVVLTLGLAACGSGDDKDSNKDPSNPGNTGGTNGTATTAGTNGGGTGSGTTAGGGTTGGGGSTGNGGTGSGNTIFFPDEDGGNSGENPRDATVVTPPPAKVQCGTSECTIKDNFACCEQASDSGWMASCVGESSCSNIGSGLIPSKSTARCDTKDDCGGLADQYCCFIRQGPPPSPFTPGTPYGRQCRTLADCNNDVAIPQGTGTFSCQKDADCPNNLKCNVEAADGNSVGKGGRTGRPWVKVCG